MTCALILIKPPCEIVAGLRITPSSQHFYYRHYLNQTTPHRALLFSAVRVLKGLEEIRK